MAAGYRHTEGSKRKIGLAQKGKIVSQETRRKIGLAHKGRKLSAETKLNWSLHWYDYPKRVARKQQAEQKKALLNREREHRQKQNAARRELARSINVFLCAERERIKSEMGWGRTKRFITEETRRRISQGNIGRKAWNKGLPAWNNGIRWPEEVKENISRGMVVYWIQRKQQIKKTY